MEKTLEDDPPPRPVTATYLGMGCDAPYPSIRPLWTTRRDVDQLVAAPKAALADQPCAIREANPTTKWDLKARPV